MKSWEETWERTELGEDYCNPVLNGQSTEVFLGTGARLQLAAAAPEMARLLLELEWSGNIGGYEHEAGCAVCLGQMPYTINVPARRIDAYTRTEARTETLGGHNSDCALVAVLRKAGVIP